jgi:phenylacetic acid degradation protein
LTIASFEGKIPSIGAGTYVHPSADVFGDVTIGEGCWIHNVKILSDYAIIGMGAVVSDWAEVGRWAVVGEGAVVRQGQVIPDEHIAVGVPARVLEKRIDEAYKAEWTRFKETYVDLARRYPSGFVPL